jgi:hypothetical protein
VFAQDAVGCGLDVSPYLFVGGVELSGGIDEGVEVCDGERLRVADAFSACGAVADEDLVLFVGEPFEDESGTTWCFEPTYRFGSRVAINSSV